MADIVIIGAGLAGVPCAYELRRQLAAVHRVTVVAPSHRFDFIPANSWLALGWRKPEEAQVDLREPMAKNGIKFVEQAAIAINPSAQQVTLQSGDVIAYDQLVVAAGPVCAFDKIPGLGPASTGGYTQALTTHAQAVEAWEAWKQFPLNPGPIVVGVAPEGAAFGPAAEFALLVDEELRRQKIRHLAPIIFFTPEPYPGHFGTGEKHGSRQFVEGQFERQNIRAIVNARLNAVAPGALHLTRYSDAGIRLADEELLFHYAMVFPSYRGPGIAGDLPAACDSSGFLRVDAHQRCIGYQNIWAVGANVAAAPAVWTPVPLGTPKIGRNIEGMVRTACINIAASVAGQPVFATHVWASQRLADFGGQGEVLGRLEKTNPAASSGDSGRWLQLVKIAYEKYFLDQVRDGVAGLPYQPDLKENLKAGRRNGIEGH